MAIQSSSDGAMAPLLRSSSASTLGPASDTSSIRDVSRDPKHRRKTQMLQTLSFVSAVLSALCVGSVTVFSLYAPRFQSRLHFTQFQINAISSGLSLALYIPVPIFGYLCDRIGPGPLSFLAAVLSAGGYGLAASIYHKGDVASSNVGPVDNGGLVPFMVVAFTLIGAGAASMYISAITTCAKNFGKGKYRGLMLTAPMASVGLSGILVSQFASHFLYEQLPDGSKGEVNVFLFFIFLATILTLSGLFGTFALRIVDEDDLIDDAVEELERSGYLEGSQMFRRTRSHHGYGAVDASTDDIEDAGILDPAKDDNENAMLKAWLLNAETKKFLSDHTMWWFAIGFWLVIGPGEAFINNLGTIIGTLYSPGPLGDNTTAATHVSIVAATSTLARILTGSLSDLVSPNPHSPHPQSGVHTRPPHSERRFTISRVVLFVLAGLSLSAGTLILASGLVQGHGDRFWLVSGFIGAGYGAVFTLTPIIVTIIWGVENFGTNFGIVALFPAVGSIMWGLIYSAVYQQGARNSPLLSDGSQDVFCYGKQCYSSTFWGMTISIWAGCAMVLWAWKGRGGWARHEVVI
jgi:MFS family permease